MPQGINYIEIENKLIQYIRTFVKDKDVIVGLSGGIDSSIVCALAVKALGKEKVKVLIVTNSRYPLENLNKSKEYAQRLGIKIQEVDIANVGVDILNCLSLDKNNIIQTSTLDARLCDLIIKTVSGLEDRIYVGTINGTERLTGWYPKGNLVGDFCPIGGLLKEQEKELSKQMGLEYLIETISLDAGRICSGCGECSDLIGISYEVLDKVLYAYETSNGDQLANDLWKLNIDKEIISKILKRVLFVDHKNNVFPNYCKLNSSKVD